MSATNAAFGTRGANVRRAFHRWTRTPRSFLFGYGFATLGDVGSGGRLTEYVVDDMPLGLALEGGAAGIVLFLALVVCCLWLAFARGLRDPFVDSARAYAVFFLLYLPISVNFRLFPAAPFFWIFMGLAASLARAHRRSVAEGGDRLGGAFTGTAVPERDPTELA